MKSILHYMYLCANEVVEYHASSALRTAMHYFIVSNLNFYFPCPWNIGNNLNATEFVGYDTILDFAWKES
jgi:hypothetical protein